MSGPADAVKQVVRAPVRLSGERVHELQPRLRAEGHRDRDRAVELDDRRAGERLGGDDGYERVREALGPDLAELAV